MYICLAFYYAWAAIRCMAAWGSAARWAGSISDRGRLRGAGSKDSSVGGGDAPVPPDTHAVCEVTPTCYEGGVNIGYTLDLDLPKATFFLPFERSGEKNDCRLIFCIFQFGQLFLPFLHLDTLKGIQASRLAVFTAHRPDWTLFKDTSEASVQGGQASRLAVFTAHRPDWTLFKDTSGASVRAAFPVRRASKPVLSGRCPNRHLGPWEFSQHTDLIGHCSRTRPKRPFGRLFPSNGRQNPSCPDAAQTFEPRCRKAVCMSSVPARCSYKDITPTSLFALNRIFRFRALSFCLFENGQKNEPIGSPGS